jgi:hypothetical protein
VEQLVREERERAAAVEAQRLQIARELQEILAHSVSLMGTE